MIAFPLLADYSAALPTYAATTIVSTTLPPTRDVRALVAHRAPYVTRNQINALRLLDPIAAFAMNNNSNNNNNNDDVDDESVEWSARLIALMNAFRFQLSSSVFNSSLGDIEEEVRVELYELRAQVAAADRKAQLAAWFASAPMDAIGKFGFTYTHIHISHPYTSFSVDHFQFLLACRFASALTAASLDALLQFSAPLPEFANGNDFLHFADVCGGPGGFSEYLMHRRQTHGAKGWGFTLRDPVADFALDRFCATAVHSNFTTHYGADGSGDVTLQTNIDSFVELVSSQTKGKMLALVMANGAEHCDSAADDRLLLAQLQLVLALVRQHGCALLRLASPHGQLAFFAASVLALCSASICVTRAPAVYGEAHMSDVAYLYARNIDETRARAAAVHLRRLMEQPVENRERFTSVGDVAGVVVDKMLPIYLQSQRLNAAMASVYALRRAIDVLVISRNAGGVAAEFAAAMTSGEVAAARAALKDRVAREWNLPREANPTNAFALPSAVKPTAAVAATTVAAVSTPSLASQRDKHKGTSVYNSSWQANTASSGGDATNATNLSAYLAPSQVKSAVSSSAGAPGTTASYAKPSSATKRPAPPTTAVPDAASGAPTAGKVIRLKPPTSTLPNLAGVDLSKYKSKLVPEKK